MQCAVLVSCCVALAACSEPETPAPPPQKVGVQKVETRTVARNISRVAQTQSSREVQVVARVSGFLDKIVYTEGSLIKQGEVMFEMDRRPFEADLQAARGELEASKARLATAEANLNRTRPLAEADAMSQSDLDTAVGERDAAAAAVFSASANVTQAELNLSYATILAPVTGLTGQAKQREGAFLNAMSESANLSYVAQVDPIWVNFSVSQNEMEEHDRLLAEGMVNSVGDGQLEFEIHLADGRVFPYKGRMNFRAPTFDDRTGTFSVRAVVPNPEYSLRPGMFVTAKVLGISRPNAVLVPQKAVQQSPNGHVVWVVGKDNKAEARPVVTGEWLDDSWIVEKGLQGSETIIVEGIRTLRPGAPIEPVPAASLAKAEGEKAEKAPDSGGDEADGPN